MARLILLLVYNIALRNSFYIHKEKQGAIETFIVQGKYLKKNSVWT